MLDYKYIKILLPNHNWANFLKTLFSILTVKDLNSQNPGQNIWTKANVFDETGQNKKILISDFLYFWTAIAKFSFFEGSWTLAYVSTQIRDYLNIYNFPEFLVVWQQHR